MSIADVPANNDFILGLGAQIGFTLLIKESIRRFTARPTGTDSVQYEKIVTIVSAALAALIITHQSSRSWPVLCGVALGAALAIWQGNNVRYLTADEVVGQRVVTTAGQVGAELSAGLRNAAAAVRIGAQFWNDFTASAGVGSGKTT